MNSIEDIKKIEVHVHLDGSVRPETIRELSGLNIDYVRDNMIVADNNDSLTNYLDKFDLPLKYMQTKDNLTRITKELLDDMILDNIVYGEIRFAPNKHTREGLSIEEVLLSVLKGTVGYRDKIKTKFILCMMRGDSEEDNFSIFELAKKYNLPVDLAGDEANYPNELYVNLFNKIKEEGLQFTIHAGEASGKTSVISALDIGTKRLGHGVKLEGDKALISRIRRSKVLLEICPTSNLNTKAFLSIKEHPCYKYYKEFLCISINTDNRTVSNTNLNKEYQLLLDNFNFTLEDFEKINLEAVNHTFLTSNEKEEIRQALKY